MRGDRPPLLLLRRKVPLDLGRRVDEEFGRDAVKELLHALAARFVVKDRDIKVTRRSRRPPYNRARGNNAGGVESFKDKGNRRLKRATIRLLQRRQGAVLVSH